MGRHVKVKCFFCGEEFLAQRRSAKFCSANHRKAYSRLFEKITDQTGNAGYAVGNIISLVQQYPHLVDYALFHLQTLENRSKAAQERLRQDFRTITRHVEG